MTKGNSSESSRRSFLKTSSAAVAGATAMSALNPVSGAHTSYDETIRIGLIGCGGRGTGAATQAMNTSGPTKLVAMADVFDASIERAHRRITAEHKDKVDVPKERQFVGVDAYQNVLDQDLDIVILATPPGFRPLHFEAAVKAGKHVFAEKPVAVDPAGVRKFLAATKMAKEKNLLVQIGLQRRHERAYMETIKRLQEGAIGNINFMRAYWNGGGVWTRTRQELADQLKRQPTEMEYQLNNWYYFNWLCGDHITEQHIHNLDVINWLKDDYPVKAQGQGGRQVRTGKENGEIYDHHMVEFTYADGSTMLSCCRHIPGCWNSVSEHASGSEGYADIADCKIFDTKGNMSWEFGQGGRNGHQQEHHDLFADLRSGKLPNEGEYGAKSTMTSIFGRLATYSGKELNWDECLNSDLVISPVEKFHSFEDMPPVLPLADMSYKIHQPGSKEPVI